MVQLKLKKPTQEKVEDEHRVEYSTIDYLKKAPEPKKKEEKSVETPHVNDKCKMIARTHAHTHTHAHAHTHMHTRTHTHTTLTT